MEDQLGSICDLHEGYEQLRQKLFDTMLELETMRNVKAELSKLLQIAYQERDQAREQLHSLAKKLVPANSNALLENLPEFPPAIKANSSFTKSNSPSNISSSPVTPLLQPVSPSPEFSNVNVNVVDNHYNFGFQKPATIDFESSVIDYLAKGKVLPQKGKLVEAVRDAGSLLETLLVAGPLPKWRNPPPLTSLKIPPLNIKEYDSLTPASKLNSFGNWWDSAQKPTFLPSSHSSEPLPMLNFAGSSFGSWNKQLQMTSKASVARNQHRLQY
ncbi:uncharacterized protein LOC130749392 isoform X2 [Lotus japonicus]|uniref:uncharacterized protein LOC130749392 isoform X2 n=1 Tax=Lotus japonicus TaxID=34305 RepID=UPI00259043A4|nr:uncharacterized protein LOC130749392 isoform X2 [Lotus japonicus]